MPYLQVDLDAMVAFGEVAVKAGLTEGEIAIGCLKMWRFCWKQKTAYVTRDRLETFFAGDIQRVIAGLVACEFVDLPTSRPDLHVRGAEKRLGITQNRSTAGKKRAAGKRDKKGRLVAEKVQQVLDAPPAPDQQPSSSAPGLTSNIQHPASSIKDIAGEAPAEQGRWASLVDSLFSVFKAKRGTAPNPQKKDWKALKELRERTKAPDAEIVLRWERGIQAQFKQRVDSFWDLNERWDALTSTAPPTQAANARFVRAQDVDKSSFANPGTVNDF